MIQREDDLAEPLLDRIDALRVVRADSEEERDALLAEIAGPDEVEREMLGELARRSALRLPDRFEEAHRLVVRALEVLDRNGARPVSLSPRLGPLARPAGRLVELLTRWIVRDYTSSATEGVRELYERREASCPWDAEERRLLRRARIDIARVESGFRGSRLGIPSFLVGGAALSLVLSSVSGVVDWALGDRIALKVTVFVVVALVLVSLAWATLVAAGVARRRIRLSCDQPMRALYETIGSCGEPPKDDSYAFAVSSLVLLALAAVLLPALVVALVV